MTDLSLLKDHLHTIYSENPFATLLQMEIVELEAGKATLSMPIKNKHTNFYNSAHGGALAALADTAMGMACTTTGKMVVTLDMNLNYIRDIPCQEALTAVGLVIHNGSRTMVATTDIFNNTHQLVVSARATFFVTGTFF
ncbi:Acyl-coenzyme A thioesterase PaaI [Sporomusa silvacetica DSM 10669]|uniref:Acyl-coenzyme A thioesterase PaaI n=1 Tax=Sporomusa silvacetica DSM 10669 TaxID=1123289 RepID=A0ABZ3IPD1_9FIRM|nr:PaaI family thioesterase [Sporomusa silvacetica]OZC23243.1 acyl-coenzyme A thioesterase PaaI [Sporomusa silvacetica DSM 10669]